MCPLVCIYFYLLFLVLLGFFPYTKVSVCGLLCAYPIICFVIIRQEKFHSMGCLVKLNYLRP